MDFKKVIIAIAVIMMVSVSVTAVMADDSDGYVQMGNISASDFKTGSSGTIHVDLQNSESRDITVLITVSDVLDPSKVYVRNQEYEIEAGDMDFTANVSFTLNDAKEYFLMVTCTCDDAQFPSGTNSDYNYVTISVTESVWSNWVTYLAIALIIILIVAAAVLKMRSKPKVKPDTTFTELERQSRSGAAAAEPEKTSTTQRKRYSGKSEQPSAPKAAPKEEAPVKTFTELEEERTAAKEKPAKSESSEPKKLKYVSSRRK